MLCVCEHLLCLFLPSDNLQQTPASNLTTQLNELELRDLSFLGQRAMKPSPFFRECKFCTNH